MKKIITLLVAFSLTITFTNIIIAETYEPELNCVNTQLARLYELRYLLSNRHSNNFETTIFSADGEPIEIPNINLIAGPRHLFGPLTIGLVVDVDYSHIEYEDTDALLEITRRQPAREVVDFILDFAGIPYGQANISYAIALLTPILPYGAPLPAICPVWGTPNPVLDDSHNTTDIFSLSTFASSMSGRIIIVTAVGIALLLFGIKLTQKA